MSRFVYVDNAATTAVSKDVLDSMTPYYTVNMEIHLACILLEEKQKKQLKPLEKI